jgi:hypothetical protein
MPVMQNAHIDRALTNISIAYMQDASKFIADKVFPSIPVTRQSDVYYTYDKGDFMRDEAVVRGAATESAGGDYGVTSGDPYFCKKYSFHKDVTPEERANYDTPLNADQDATDFVTGKMLIRREMQWASKFFKTGVWGTEITGVSANASGNNVLTWDLATSDPIMNITNQAVKMAGATGYKPNTLVLSPYVFYALKNHDEVLDRIKYTQKGIVTTDLLAQLFEVDNVYIAWGVVNSATKNVTDSINFIFGKSALLCYSNPRPALKQPSAGYIFSWSGLEGAGGFGNRIVRLPMDQLGLGTERIEGEIAFDAKTICTDLGCFFNSIVA